MTSTTKNVLRQLISASATKLEIKGSFIATVGKTCGQNKGKASRIIHKISESAAGIAMPKTKLSFVTAFGSDKQRHC